MTKKRALTTKTPEEIERLARGGEILRTILEELALLVRPGMTGLELDAEAEKRLRGAGAEPSFKGYAPSGDPDHAYPFSLIVSRNEEVVHGLPTAEPFREGDVIKLDLGARYEGMYTDTAMTVIAGKASADAERLVSVTRKALDTAVRIVRAGVRTGDIGAAIQNVVESAGFSVVRDLVGHGVGYDVHEEPSIPNFGRKGHGVELPSGAVIAIEPMVIIGKHDVELAQDGWTVISSDKTLTAHEERTLAVTPTGARVLTTTRKT